MCPGLGPQGHSSLQPQLTWVQAAQRPSAGCPGSLHTSGWGSGSLNWGAAWAPPGLCLRVMEWSCHPGSLLSHLCRLGGSLYVRRGSRSEGGAAPQQLRGEAGGRRGGCCCGHSVAFQGQRKSPPQMLLADCRDTGKIRPSGRPWSIMNMKRTPKLFLNAQRLTPHIPPGSD